MRLGLEACVVETDQAEFGCRRWRDENVIEADELRRQSY
jgi:hypothetical protein